MLIISLAVTLCFIDTKESHLFSKGTMKQKEEYLLSPLTADMRQSERKDEKTGKRMGAKRRGRR